MTIRFPNEVKDLQSSRFYEIEIEKLFDAILSFQDSRIKLFTFFGTVNLGAIGVGFTVQSAMIFILSGILLYIASLVDMIMVAILARFYYRAYLLEKSMVPRDEDTFLTMFFMDDLGTKIKAITKIQDKNKRNSELTKIPIKHLHLSGFWLPVGVGTFEILLGVFLVIEWGWSYF